MEQVALTVKDLARATGLSEEHVRRQIRAGIIKAARVGRKLLIPQEEAEKWFRKLGLRG